MPRAPTLFLSVRVVPRVCCLSLAFLGLLCPFLGLFLRFLSLLCALLGLFLRFLSLLCAFLGLLGHLLAFLSVALCALVVY